MNILCHVMFLLLLGVISCQNNNRNAKSGGKPAKKPNSQAIETTQHGPEDDPNPALAGAGDSSKETNSGGRGNAQQSTSVNKPVDEMKLHFLKNTLVMCNDGTAAGFYLKEFKGSKRWLIFLEGGWCCYNKETCDSRYKTIPRLMSSTDWPQTRKGTGLLSTQVDENPHWYNANIVFVPYCSSDVWSGNKAASKSKQGKETEYAFMGSQIIREVIKDLVQKGLKQAKVVMLAGTSAGGAGVLLNIDKVSSLLEQLGADAQVRGLVDSGWFLESKQQKAPDCPDSASCTPVDVIKKGLRLWSGVVPEKCKQQYKRGEEWQCFFGHKLYTYITAPLFVVQWLFDEEQLRVENIYMGVNNYNWMDFQIKGTSLSRALQCWDRSLQEAIKNSKTPLKGCPFHLIDNCQWPQCNPTCPALIDQATQQEMTLLQVLASMGLDLQKLGLDVSGDISASMVSSGG
uniref:Carboxylesterase notum2 n=1 Tax=Sinocyclocheilus anshuiensis TaxID=1608454 RepID=A0A671TCB2_9TELE